MKKKIISKIPHHSGFDGYTVTISNGENWSILNFADSMRNHPYPYGVYLGWEGLNSQGEIIRGDTADEIIKQILK